MEKGTVVISLRSKGLGSFNSAFFDLRLQTFSIGRQAVDLVIGLVLTIFHLSWTAWVAILIALVSSAEDISSDSWLMEEPLQDATKTIITSSDVAVAYYLPFLGALFLPLLALVVMVFWRREQALSHMASFKSNAVGICLAACGDDAAHGLLHEGADAIQKQTLVLLEDLHR
jgi:hypothetical protein